MGRRKTPAPRRFRPLLARLNCAAGRAGALVVLLALAQAAPGLSAQPLAASDGASAPLQLRFEPALRESNAEIRDGRATYGRGDRATARVGRDATLEGDAELRRAGTVVRADRITYYQADEEVIAVGNVRISREGNLFVGSQLRLRLDTNEGSFVSPAYFLPQFNGRGRADLIEFLGSDRTRLTRATYTTCEPDDPDWILQARTLTLDEADGSGSGRSASLSFMGVKILALPAFAFPLGDERKSGVLPPTMSINSRTGLDVVVPYYWNMAPNRDFTFYPRLSTKRGVQLGAEFRYLEPRYQGDISFELNPDDQVTGQARYYYQLRHGFRDYAGWAGGWEVRDVSDDDYFIDYSRSIMTSSDRVLPQRFYATRTVARDWSLLVDVQKWKPILDSRPGPYEKVPQLQLRQLRRDVAGFDIDTTVDSTLFAAPTPTGPQGWRIYANPQMSWPIVRPGWSIVPKLSVHASSYQLERNASYDTTLTRVLPTYSIDAGMQFERPAEFFGREFTQTLEPRLFYAYTPYRDQSEFPVFDSATTDFSFAQLFSENTFVGNDRIADSNHLTAAAVSRLIDPATGAEKMRFAVGQRVFFDDQRVTLPGVPPSSAGRTDILLAAYGDLGSGMSFDTGLQYTVDKANVPRFSALWRWLPREGQVLNVGARYRQEEIGQLDTSWRWPLARRWMSMVRLNYSFLDKGVDPVSGIPNQRGMVESVLGLEYDACCWISRFVLQRYTTGADTATTAFFFQLELKGLSRIGNDPFDILRRNIPGFRVPDGRPGSVSRYFGYE